MKSIWRNNSLSITFFGLFFITWIAQAITGYKEHNEELSSLHSAAIGFKEYLSTGHFLEATFENFESEFLQMALFVLLSMFLFQKGSAESKDPDKKEDVNKEPDPKKEDAPWAVKQGGVVLKLFNHSLFYSLFLLFILSFLGHWYGSLKDYNEQQSLQHLPEKSAFEYLGEVRLWFESFQNWQSEFLSVFAIVVLSIFFREKGSPQSKPVDAAHYETGK